MKELKKQLANGIVTGIYLFITEDRYLSDSYISQIEKMTVGPEWKSLNYNYFDLTTDPSNLIPSLTGMPVMSERRMVVFEFGEIKSKNDTKTENIINTLTDYLRDPSEYAVLIVSCKNIDKRSAFYKLFKEKGKIAEFKKPKRADFYDWIEGEFSKRGVKANRDVINHIINSVDYNGRESEVDMGYFINEIEKVSMIDPKAKIITLDMARKVVSTGVNADIFKLTDSLTSGDLPGVYKQLYKLSYNNVPSQKTLATIATTMRNIAICQSVYESGKKEEDIAKEYSINPYVVKTSISMRGMFSYMDALKALKLLSDADMDIKTGRLSDEAALMNVCTMICTKVFM
ncbi:MAG: DNA polymerase III subunit delta [Eubacteriaceae bacterium]|nr:DNA polymerase III subunit delta [Eubacteriaceae bacterium]